MGKLKENSWLISGGFLKRSLSIWWHNFVANLLISIVFLVILTTLIYFFFGEDIIYLIDNADTFLEDADKIGGILNKVIDNLDQLDELSKYLP